MILTEEQLLIQETARKFAQERLLPNSAEWERKAAFPPGLFRELGELGFMGMTVPTEWGGAGYMQDFGVERIYRAVRGAKIYEGTNDIQRLVIGRSLV